MPTPTKGARLGGSAAHQRLILANLATQLFENGKITTTEARAKRLRPFAEKLITKARRGDLHSRRLVQKTVRDTDVVHTLFTEIAPAMEGREGGYTRITKLSPRKGDNAPMALIELITEKVEPKTKAAATTEPDAAVAANQAEEAAAEEATEVEATDEAAAEETAEVEATEDAATEEAAEPADEGTKSE